MSTATKRRPKKAAPAEPTPVGDDATARWLDSLHVDWTYVGEFPLDRIDLKRSLANQARIAEPLIPEVVERYTADYQHGDTFPALIVRQVGRSRPYLLGGNHRTHAAIAAGRDTHPAYIVTCTDTAALALMYGDNRRHGMPPTREERRAQAAHLVESGWTAKDAALAVGISEPELSNYRNVQRTSRRAAELGVGALYDTLPMTHRTRLAVLNADPVFTAAVRLVGTAGLTGPQTDRIVKRVRAARSEAAALRIIENEVETHRDAAQDRAANQRVRNRPTPYGKLTNALNTVIELHTDELVLPATATVERLRERVKAGVAALEAIDRSLGKR